MMDVEKYGVVGLLFVAAILALVLFYGPEEEPETAGTELKTGAAASTQAPRTVAAGAQRAPRPGGSNFQHASAAAPAPKNSRVERYELAGAVDSSNSEPFDFDDQDFRSFEAASISPKSGRCSYVIQSGDVLGKIAQRELGKALRAKDLIAWNPGLDPLALQVGQVIRLCPPGSDAPPSARTSAAPAAKPASQPSASAQGARSYIVVKGDSLSVIAYEQLGSIVHTDALFEANRHVLKDRDALAPGMQLVLPMVGDLAGKN
ncbi:MAG: hypothetical protein DHS20C15_20740 [Planctomycetota bacterium]|nr:MAG: hypothetical protein DHS20C15_20740 [Planctomycetota bacterium]